MDKYMVAICDEEGYAIYQKSCNRFAEGAILYNELSGGIFYRKVQIVFTDDDGKIIKHEIRGF